MVGVAVGAGGALGALARYGVDTLIERRSVALYPWSTFTINVSGCFVIGIVIAALVDRHHTPQWLRAASVVGFLGAYTTFSTFGQETLDLLRAEDYAVALANVLGNVVVGVVAVWLGSAVGRTL
jgi:CrcB protein